MEDRSVKCEYYVDSGGGRETTETKGERHKEGCVWVVRRTYGLCGEKERRVGLVGCLGQSMAWDQGG